MYESFQFVGTEKLSINAGFIQPNHHLYFEKLRNAAGKAILVPANRITFVEDGFLYQPARVTGDGNNETVSSDIEVLYSQKSESLSTELEKLGVVYRFAISVTSAASQTVTIFNPFRRAVVEVSARSATDLTLTRVRKREFLRCRLIHYTTLDADISRTYSTRYLDRTDASTKTSYQILAAMTTNRVVDEDFSGDDVQFVYSTTLVPAQTETVDIEIVPD